MKNVIIVQKPSSVRVLLGAKLISERGVRVLISAYKLGLWANNIIAPYFQLFHLLPK